MSESANSKRIAKNTLVLYVRMLFLMAISLYTSRVILETLGIEDFGIYNVVGGFVALFSIVSKSLTGAASRFINFAMGGGDHDLVRRTFSSIVTVQILLACIVAFLAEGVGVWFLNHKIVIPDDRLYAANWCFQISVITFCYNLITVPYNAAIIAHERMQVFAYVSLFEGVSKLVISILISFSPIDKLIFYALLLCVLQLVVREMYRLYCKNQFEECTYRFIFDKGLLKELLCYSGWGYIGSTAEVLRNQGINVLINLFFGPSINAARAIANQVLHAISGFIENFITAVRPQLVQSYAAGNIDYVNKLIVMSSKFSFFLFFVLSLPVFLNTEFLLSVWLKKVPEETTIFVQLTMLFSLFTILYRPISIAQAATGKIRDYQLVVSGIQLLNLPVSYFLLKLGCPAYTVLIVAVLLAFVVLFLSIYMIRRIMTFDACLFFNQVLLKVFLVGVMAFPAPLLLKVVFPNSIFGVMLNCLLCVLSTVISIIFLGCNQKERNFVLSKLHVNRLL